MAFVTGSGQEESQHEARGRLAPGNVVFRLARGAASPQIPLWVNSLGYGPVRVKGP